MRSCKRAVLAGLAALMLVAAGAGGAAASYSFNETAFRTAWREMEFVLANELGPVTEVMRCPVTLEGTFHSATIADVRNTAIGETTRASSGTCTGGSLTILTATLPWTLTYLQTLGPLPFTLQMSLGAVSWQASIGGLTCLARATAESPAKELFRTTEAGAVIAKTDESINLPVTGTRCERLHLDYEGATGATRAGRTESLVVRRI